MPSKHCCWGTCKHDSRYRPLMEGEFFVEFPHPLSDLQKHNKWIHLCGRRNFQAADPSRDNKVYWRKYLCSTHFVGRNGPSEINPDPLPAHLTAEQIDKVNRAQRKTRNSKQQCPAASKSEGRQNTARSLPQRSSTSTTSSVTLNATTSALTASRSPPALPATHALSTLRSPPALPATHALTALRSPPALPATHALTASRSPPALPATHALTASRSPPALPATHALTTFRSPPALPATHALTAFRSPPTLPATHVLTTSRSPPALPATHTLTALRSPPALPATHALTASRSPPTLPATHALTASRSPPTLPATHALSTLRSPPALPATHALSTLRSPPALPATHALTASRSPPTLQTMPAPSSECGGLQGSPSAQLKDKQVQSRNIKRKRQMEESPSLQAPLFHAQMEDSSATHPPAKRVKETRSPDAEGGITISDVAKLSCELVVARNRIRSLEQELATLKHTYLLAQTVPTCVICQKARLSSQKVTDAQLPVPAQKESCSSLQNIAEQEQNKKVGRQISEIVTNTKGGREDSRAEISKEDKRRNCLFTYDALSQHADMFEYYTGLTVATFGMLWQFVSKEAKNMNYVRPSVNEEPKTEKCFKKSRIFQLKDELVLTLLRLRRGRSLREIAFEIGVSETYMSRLFTTWIQLLYTKFQTLRNVMFSSLAHVQKHTPPLLKGHNVRVIIDCTEFACHQPKNFAKNGNRYSAYKGRTTFKVLVGISPAGTISYISEAFEGAITDVEIVRACDFLSFIQKGDVVMADRGFLIGHVLARKGAKVLIPPFLKGRRWFSPQEEAKTKFIAKHRIHVERAIQRIKQFKLFSSSISAKMEDLVSQCLFIAACLVNFQKPLAY